MTTNSNGIDVWLLKELGCRTLVSCLEELPGQKDLVIDKTLMKMLDRLAQATTLRKHEVDKMFKLEKVPPNAGCSQRVYLSRPTPDVLKTILDHVTHQQNQEQKLTNVLIVCVPRVTCTARSFLEEEGFGGGGLVKLHPFCPGFIPIDDDLLTLEMPTFFKDAFVDGDYSACVGIGQGLSTLESIYGKPCKVFAHGRGASAVMKAAKLFEASDFQESKKPQKCEIGHMFIFDRDADFVTPMLTQLTYEGSIDEHYEIQAGVVELPESVVASADGEKKRPSKVMLNSKDAVFETIRNKHFAGVAGQLVRNAEEIKRKKDGSRNMSPAEMKEFVANKLKDLQLQQSSISLHLSICEAITRATRRDFDVQLTTEHGLITGGESFSDAKAYFEDCCARQLGFNTCLRLLCLMSLTQNSGLITRDYERLATHFLVAFGYRHLNTLFDLRKSGLLVTNVPSTTDSASSAMKGLRQAASNLMNRDQIGRWKSLSKSLKLVPDLDDVIELHDPSHLSYVFNGAYTPAIPQLVSVCLTKGLPHITEALRCLSGSSFSDGWTDDRPNFSQSPPPVIVIIILGGVTFAEIAAFKLLGIKTGNRIIVASTGTVTGNKLMAGVANASSF